MTGVLSQSILPWLSRTREHDSAALLVKFTSLTAIAMLGMAIIVYPLIEPLFAFVFGEQWREAGIYASPVSYTHLASIVESSCWIIGDG